MGRGRRPRLHRRYQLQLIILPQALRIAVPPTVGSHVQLAKSTALTSIIEFDEPLRAGNVITNATFAPFTVYGVMALVYFAVCFPLTLPDRRLELRLSRA